MKNPENLFGDMFYADRVLSGLEMFIVGGVAAAAAYGIGALVSMFVN